jgi:hypothetical protein
MSELRKSADILKNIAADYIS